MNAIDIRDLCKQFGKRTAVDHISLTVADGEMFALLGQNGAGKTTTIQILTGLLRPSCGEALLLGQSIVKRPTAVKSSIGLSPQETAVAPKLSVRENLRLMAEIYGNSRSEANMRAEEMMARFGLMQQERQWAKTLSGGMQRRLSIAMALIANPAVLFLDEPTLGLDVRARRDLWKLIADLKGHMSIVLTTHYLEEAEALADRIGIMDHGRLQIVGTAEEIKQKTGTDTLEEAFLQLTDEEEVAS